MQCVLSFKAHVGYYTALFLPFICLSRWVHFGDSTLNTAHWFPFFCSHFFFHSERVRCSPCGPLIAVFIASQIHSGFHSSELRHEAGKPPKLSKKRFPTDTETQKYSSPHRQMSLQRYDTPDPQMWMQLLTWGGLRWIQSAGDSLWMDPHGLLGGEALNWATRRPEADGCEVGWCHHLLLPFVSGTARVGAMWQTPSQAQTLVLFVGMFHLINNLLGESERVTWPFIMISPEADACALHGAR